MQLQRRQRVTRALLLVSVDTRAPSRQLPRPRNRGGGKRESPISIYFNKTPPPSASHRGIMMLFLVLAASCVDTAAALLPPWPPTFSLQRSTIGMPANESGYLDVGLASKFGIIDLDWSNSKAHWSAAQPMNDEELLIEQAAEIKAASGGKTRVFVYRNLVKALPWYTTVRERLDNPAYESWFLKYRTDRANFTSPACDPHFSPPRCSKFYHDQANMGSIRPYCASQQCDCGKHPCGEYLWNHANGSQLREFLLHEFVAGATGLSNPAVDGMYFDDGWTNTSCAKKSTCSCSSVGGPTEVEGHCMDDMGLDQAQVTAITQEWKQTVAALAGVIKQHKAFSWQVSEQRSFLSHFSSLRVGSQ